MQAITCWRQSRGSPRPLRSQWGINGPTEKFLSAVWLKLAPLRHIYSAFSPRSSLSLRQSRFCSQVLRSCLSSLPRIVQPPPPLHEHTRLPSGSNAPCRLSRHTSCSVVFTVWPHRRPAFVTTCGQSGFFLFIFFNYLQSQAKSGWRHFLTRARSHLWLRMCLMRNNRDLFLLI